MANVCGTVTSCRFVGGKLYVGYHLHLEGGPELESGVEMDPTVTVAQINNAIDTAMRQQANLAGMPVAAQERVRIFGAAVQ